MTDLLGLMVQNYLLERQIGESNLSQLYLAHDYQAQKSAACKVAKANAAQIDLVQQLFLQEAAIGHQLHHPHILPVEAYGELQPEGADRALPYLLMPYMAGGNVAQHRQHLAQQRQPIPTAEAVKLVYLVASALVVAHAQNIFHLDIKPENLLLATPGNLATVMVADFGAQPVAAPQQVGQPLLGTPAYMAPEQLAGNVGNAQSDIFALGVVLYELITGKRPFPGTGQATVFLRQKEPISLADVPKSLQAVVQRSLAFAPEDRYPTAQLFADDLRQWLLNQTSEAAGGRIPQPGDPHQTRLIATNWLPPVTQWRGIDFTERWHGGRFRFYIAHPDGRVDIKPISHETRILEIGRTAPQNGAINGNRSPEIDFIILPDFHVSQRHAVLEQVGNGWLISDNYSTNGTFLEGEQLEPKKPVYWRGRTKVRIGPYILVWQAYDKFGLSLEQENDEYLQDEMRWRQLDDTQYWLSPHTETAFDVVLMPNEPLRLSPGGTAELSATISSQSPILERVELLIKELPPSWYTIAQTDLVPVAGYEQTVAIQIHPPKDGVKAGRYTGQLVVYAPRTDEEHAPHLLTLEILPTDGNVFDLHPQTLDGAGQTQLTIWNTGNRPASYLVLARDPANGLEINPPKKTVVVPPGTQDAHSVSIQPAVRRPLLPPAKQLPYELRVGRSESELETVAGQVELKPLLPLWLLIVIPLLAVLLYLIIPPLVSRAQAKQTAVAVAEERLANAQATQVSADATKIIAEALLAGYSPEPGETPSAEIQAVQTAQADAEAASAGAQTENAAAAAALADAEAISPVGPAIPPAQPPTAVLLDNNSIAEDAPPGTVVGLLSSEDPDEMDSHSYSLVSGEGDSDNAFFFLEGSQLKLLGSLDYETQPTLSVRVQSLDARGESFAQRLTLDVVDANEPFTAVALSNQSVEENVLSANVGELTAVGDPDENDSHTFTLADDPSNLLEISGASLRVKPGESLNFETWPSGIPLEIGAEDGGGNAITQTVTITVTDANDLPVLMGLGDGTVEDEVLEIRLDTFVTACQDEDEPSGCQLSKIQITQPPTAGFLLLVERNFAYDPDVPLTPEQSVFEGREIPLVSFQKLLFVPDRNFNGRVQFRWNGYDSEDYAAQPAAFTINVTPSVDPPTFVPDSGQITVEEDAGPQNFNWATSIQHPDGDINDLRFALCNSANIDTALFRTGPTVTPGGNVEFEPALNQNGSTTLKILLTDAPSPPDGDETAVCANQATVSLQLLIQPTNDPPIINASSPLDYPTQSSPVFSNITIIDLDNFGDGSFNFEGGFIEIFLRGEQTETITLTTDGTIKIDSNDNVELNDKTIGTIDGNDTTYIRIINLTENATIEAIESLLEAINLNICTSTSTLTCDQVVSVVLNLNDGGNIDYRGLPEESTVTVNVRMD